MRCPFDAILYFADFPLLVLFRMLVGIGEASFVALAAPLIGTVLVLCCKARSFEGSRKTCIPSNQKCYLVQTTLRLEPRRRSGLRSSTFAYQPDTHSATYWGESLLGL